MILEILQVTWFCLKEGISQYILLGPSRPRSEQCTSLAGLRSYILAQVQIPALLLTGCVTVDK